MGWRRILGLMGLYPLPRTVRTDAEARAEEAAIKGWPETWQDVPAPPPLVPAHQQPAVIEKRGGMSLRHGGERPTTPPPKPSDSARSARPR